MTANEPARGAGNDDEPRFREPWEAQAFALVLALHEAKLFGWNEWAAALSREIHAPQESGRVEGGSAYYRCWLAALESLIVEKGASKPGSAGRAGGGVGARRAGDAAWSADRARQRSARRRRRV